MFAALRKHTWDVFLTLLRNEPMVTKVDEESGHTILTLAMEEGAPSPVMRAITEAFAQVQVVYSCEGCKINAPDQMSHMQPGGCLSQF